MIRIIGLFVILGLLAGLPAAARGDEFVEVTWDELAAVLPGRTVTLRLRDGCSLEADVSSVKPDSLALVVRKTSAPGLHARGSGEISRAAINQLAVLRRRPWFLAWLGTRRTRLAILKETSY